MNLLKPDTWPKLLLLIGSRYLVFAGIFWLIWYVVLKKKVRLSKIQQRFPKSKDYLREIGYSMFSVIIFAAYPAAMLLSPFRKYTLYYSKIHDHSLLWFWLAIPLMFFLHDTYFYWVHRLMHHPKVFRRVHLVHHQSTNPSPFAALAFHPFEAVLEAAVFGMFLMIMPLHPIHLAIFFTVQMAYNVYGHLGWELYSTKFLQGPIGRWINTSRAHNAHHQYFTGNYGLYFLWWDRWFGTIREVRFPQKMNEVVEERKIEMIVGRNPDQNSNSGTKGLPSPDGFPAKAI